MVDKIGSFFEENFNMELIQSLDLQPGRYRTSMIFRITSEGTVTDVKANNYRGIEEIEKEAIRVALMLPGMKPGTQRGKVVGVIYGLPIVFDIEPEGKKQRKKRVKN
ncbi:MAG: energy transducer TonB [Bacteroidia bacterium]|nr:energy transducer TonB [Bacteroidia bacterium]NNF29827.1 hypothetical protein [Flavobacteriaceae bacterium]MBT8275973.1 energy transducer TonB [Bacteroidia bacterium]NNJ82981.1 hypothetical protein [Flavobacteriaceae bacterium]NNK53813.1 hypothetical protein [Flavobacteriaceae bacterium]